MTRAFRLAGLAVVLAAAPLGAQGAAVAPTAGMEASVARASSPLLAGEHWALDALQRAEALGLLRGAPGAEGSVPIYSAGASLARAARLAPEIAPASAPLAHAWYRRFVEEFPEFGRRMGGGETPPAAIQRAALFGGYEAATGRAAPGLSELPTGTGASPIPDRSGAVTSAVAAVRLGSHVAAEVAPRVRAGGLDLPGFELVVGAGNWSLSAGRREVGYETSPGRGVVLSGQVRLDRVQIASRTPFTFPSVLRVLGPSTLHSFVSRLDGERHPGSPWYWGMRGTVQPHARLTLSLQRAIMFGGETSTFSPTLSQFVLMFIGSASGGAAENQEVSAGVRLRLPTERLLPLSAYAEWGTEDTAGAWKDVPGQIAGLYAPALPFFPGLSVGAEYARFSERCCGNPAWYRHIGFPGGWAGPERPLGHPVGGEGTELRVYTSTDLAAADLRIGVDAFSRNRVGNNLYVPGRGGTSRGFVATGRWRLRTVADAEVSFSREGGEGWAEREIRVGATFFH